MAVQVVAQGTIVNWATSFSNPVVPAKYQQGDFIVVLVMISGSLSAYSPSGFSRVGSATSSSLTLFYRKMPSGGTNLNLVGLSGTGAVRYLIVRGASQVIQAGNTDGSAKNISVPTAGQFVMVTTGNAGGLEFQNQGYSVLPSQWGTNTNYYTVAYKSIIGSFYMPQHLIWGANENFIVFSALDGNLFNQTWEFGYVGGYQLFTAPVTANYRLKVWGAQGSGTSAGRGGYSTGVLSLSKGTNLYIYVGQQGQSETSAFNGGGESRSTSLNDNGGGGGGTDIRLLGGNWDNANGLYSRIIVAGGGGGGRGPGGAGGGLVGGYPGGTQSEGGTGYIGGTSTGSFGRGGYYTMPDDDPGGGGGWYGGGIVRDHYGGGGSGYVLTSTSHKPQGYTVPDLYYMVDAETIGGASSMPSPSGGTQIGQTGNGYATITAIGPVANYSHFVIKQGELYYIPNANFYDLEAKEFIPVEFNYLINIANSDSRASFSSNLSDTFTKMIEVPGESFYIHEKFSNFQIIKISGYVEELPIKYTIENGIRFFHRFTKKYLERTSVTIKDAFSNVKDIYQYFADIVNNPPVRIGIVKDEVCYGKDYKIIDYEEIIDKGFEPVDLSSQYIDFDNFKIIFMFHDTPSIASDYLKTFKINKKIGNTNRIMTDEEYKIYHKKDNEYSYIGIVNETERVSLNKLGNTTEYLRIDSLEEF